jgi:hypothetical protein
MRSGSTWRLGMWRRKHLTPSGNSPCATPCPYIQSTALQDIKATVNATTGALSFSTVQAGTGGVINWVTFFHNLLRGGYNGAGEAQIEYSIVGANGFTTNGTASLLMALHLQLEAIRPYRLSKV